MFATLGADITFETLTSWESFRSSKEYHYAKHKVVQARPRLQWIFDELEKISLEMVFHVAYTNPATQMNILRAAAEDHQARALVFANGVHRGYFVIESIEETFTQNADDGSIVASSARVELREWAPGADIDPFAPAQPGFPPPGVIYAGNPARTPLFSNPGPGNPAFTPLPLNPGDFTPAFTPTPTPNNDFFGQPAPQEI